MTYIVRKENDELYVHFDKEADGFVLNKKAVGSCIFNKKNGGGVASFFKKETGYNFIIKKVNTIKEISNGKERNVFFTFSIK